MSELKPCPFCGGEALLHQGVTRINCTECPAVMNGVQGTEQLIKTWNTRIERQWIPVSEETPPANTFIWLKYPDREALHLARTNEGFALPERALWTVATPPQPPKEEGD